jgi:radical SAM protein with 4Fe4S-binding SPASM domain
MTVEDLHESGFDQSYEREDGTLRVRCSRCEALVICGTPCHETNCPNSKFSGEEPDDDFEYEEME